MDTKVTFDGVTFDLQMYEPPFEIKDRGWVHHARLVGSYDSDAVRKALCGKQLWSQTILGIESFAIMRLNDGSPIGILTKERMWNGKD